MSTLVTTPRFDAIEQHPDEAVTAYTYIQTDEPTMRALAQELFGTYWRSVVVGPCIEGAVFEVSFQTPDWSRLDVYYRLRAQFLGEAMPEDFEAIASLPLPERV